MNRVISRVQLTIEINGATYDDSWNLAAIVKQSSGEAKTRINNILKKENVVIIGEPIVKTVTTIEDN